MRLDSLDTPPADGPFCFGDGPGTACPCGNESPQGSCAGCIKSTGGGVLAAAGTASGANDSLVLYGFDMPSRSALYFQGTTESGSGSGALFGDGLRCASGAVVRLGTTQNVGGASLYPDATDPSISVRGGTSAADTRTHQVWYRNALNFCTSSTFNLTNGYRIPWAPWHAGTRRDPSTEPLPRGSDGPEFEHRPRNRPAGVAGSRTMEEDQGGGNTLAPPCGRSRCSPRDHLRNR